MESTPISTLNKKAHAVRGFTLIEMLVVLGIMSVLSLVVLTGQSSFNNSLVLSDTAYSVAFTARQAQSFGLSSRKYGSVQNTGYGLQFNNTTPDQYILYADTYNGFLNKTAGFCPVNAGQPDAKPGDCLFTPGGGTKDTVISTNIFKNGYTISRFCARIVGGAIKCSDDTSGALNALNVLFIRPNNTTIFTLSYSSVTKQGLCAEITIQAPNNGPTRTVRISKFGEISVNQTCP